MSWARKWRRPEICWTLPKRLKIQHSIMLTNILQSLFAYKASANSELFSLLGTLPPSQAHQLQACIRTLNHIYVVDRIFRAHLCEEPCPFDATNTPATPALGDLYRDVEATDALGI